MADRYAVGRAQSLPSCPTLTDGLGCRLSRWAHILDLLQGADSFQMIRQVNAFINRIPYAGDGDNYQQDDYWASPYEFMEFGGDCEDYAIAKYLSLRVLGFSSDDLRIVLVDDTRTRLPHAVLVVFAAGQAWMLDSLSDSVLDASTIGYYVPVFSFNEEQTWLHLGSQ